MSLYQQVNQFQQSRNGSLIQQINQIKEEYRQLKNCTNPTGMLQNMLANSPNSQEILKYLKGAGGNPQQAFLNMAQDKGANPNDIINMLR